MSPCHHIVTGLNNTYYCLKCLYCEYNVDHGDSSDHGDSTDHGDSADHGTYPIMHLMLPVWCFIMHFIFI